MNLPTVTFVIATLSEEKRIEGCLKSILNINYPKDKMEIIVSDGGSTDRTIDIAQSYGCKIYYNKRQLAEPGLADGFRQARNELVVHIATDNILPEKDWLKKMVTPFVEDLEIVGGFCKVINDPRDNAFSKYFNSDTDPFNAFIYGYASHPDKFHKLYRTLKRGNDYIVYDYSLSEYPLLALAQGFILRKRSLYRNPESDYDDILPVLDLIKQRKKIAYVTNTGIYHYSLKGFRDFLRKYNTRSKNALKHGFKKRRRFLSVKRKIKQYLWFPYSLSVILPLLAAFRNFFRKKKLYYFYHPIACFSLTVIVIFNSLKAFKRKT